MRKLKKYCALLLIIISSLDVFGQGKSILWEISGNGLTDTSYLFGTIHIRDKRVFNLGDSTYFAINHSSALFGELDLQDKEEIKKVLNEKLPHVKIFQAYQNDEKFIVDIIPI